MILDCPKSKGPIHENACNLKQHNTPLMSPVKRRASGCDETCHRYGTKQVPEPTAKPEPVRKAEQAPEPKQARRAKQATEPEEESMEQTEPKTPEKPKTGQGREIDPEKVRIGQKVRRLREAAGWSRAVLAARVGVHFSSIGNLETGKCLPNLDNRAAIAEALGTTWEEIEREARGALPPELFQEQGELPPGTVQGLPGYMQEGGPAVFVDFRGFEDILGKFRERARQRGLSEAEMLRFMAAQEVRHFGSEEGA